MRYKKGVDKKQPLLFPPCLDEYIPMGHICRVISAFTEQLDMVALGYKYSQSKLTGRLAYDPRMMLNLYLYGYVRRIRSSRRLEAEAGRNLEVMWLMDGLVPDDKTICNFRKDNTTALRKTFREFSRLCQALELYGGELNAVDSLKVRADNSRKNNHNQTTVERTLSGIDKRISEYMNALEEADAQEANGEADPDAEKILAALEKLNNRKLKFEDLLTRLETEREVSTVDPDSRLMRQGGDSRARDVCYNVQTIVDDKHKLIVDFDVIDRSDDKGNLQNMTTRAMDIMETNSLTVLADKGYYDGEDIVACERNGVTCLVAKPAPGGKKPPSEEFRRDKFQYDKENNCYICPGNNALRFMRKAKHSDGKEYNVYANYAACRQCPQREHCTTGEYRQILRLLYQDELDIVDERTRSNKELYRKRQEIVEHPFGTVKAIWGFRQFLCRTKPKVTAEMALTYLAYNLRRVTNILEENGTLLAAIRG